MKYEIDLKKLGKQREPKASDPIVKALAKARLLEALASLAEVILTMSEDTRASLSEALIKTLAPHATEQGRNDLFTTFSEHNATIKKPTKETA